MLIYYLIGAAALIALSVAFFVATYKVVDPNDAHVVVFMGRGRKLYSPDNDNKSSYFFIPILMKKFILPLVNQKMSIHDIKLNDKEVAPFICDVVTWLRISDPIVAAERLNLSDPFGSLREDLINIVQAVARSVSMKKEILEIMRDRQEFSKLVSDEVSEQLQKWGVELVNLEINEIRDDSNKGSTVIQDYEAIRRAAVQSESRKKVAIENAEAEKVEAEKMKEAELAKAESEETYRKRQIEKDRTIGVEEQEKAKLIAKRQREANVEGVEAMRVAEVGKAEVKKEATIKTAEGESEAIRIQGEKEAEVVRLRGVAQAESNQAVGLADAEVIKQKGLSEAEAKDKMAAALARFNDAATVIEKIHAAVEVEKAKYEAVGKISQNADLKMVTSGDGANFFGIPMNAETGANFGQMLEGLDLEKIMGFLGMDGDVIDGEEA